MERQIETRKKKKKKNALWNLSLRFIFTFFILLLLYLHNCLWIPCSIHFFFLSVAFVKCSSAKWKMISIIQLRWRTIGNTRKEKKKLMHWHFYKRSNYFVSLLSYFIYVLVKSSFFDSLSRRKNINVYVIHLFFFFLFRFPFL